MLRTKKSNNVDAAIVSIGDSKWLACIIDIGDVAGTHTVTQSEAATGTGYPVRLRGRTSRLTKGRVVGINYSGTVNGGNFDDSLDIEGDANWSESGDSGSAVVNVDNEVVGLHWGGMGDDGAASKIDQVMLGLNIRIALPGDVPTSYRMELLQVINYQELGDSVTQQLSQSAEGRGFLKLYDDNKQEIQNLVQTNKRVAVVWRANDGPALLQMLSQGVHVADKPMPTEFNGTPIETLLGNITGILMRYGSPKLQSAIEDNTQTAVSFLGKSWNQILGGLD